MGRDVNEFKKETLKLFWPNVRKNCSTDHEKSLKFEADGWEFANFLRSLEQFVQTVKDRTIFGNRMFFSFLPGGFSDLIN